MRAGIIGYGFVGQAVASVINDDVHLSILDPNHSQSSLQDFVETQPSIIFICVPTPTVDGACDDSLVINYVADLKDYVGQIIIKSTIPPATVEKIIAIRANTIFWPETLRAKHALHDMRYPSIMVIGAEDRKAEMLIKFIKEHTYICPAQTPDIVSPVEASVFKYMMNSFLATKVVFMHQMYRWLVTRGEGDSWNTIGNLLDSEGRIGHSHLSAPGEHGLGFAGACFPKDTEALIEQAKKDGAELPLLQAAVEQNKKLRSE